jgi:hypothetical protein
MSKRDDERSEELQEYHNKGQEDGANFEHHTPHGPGAILLAEIISGESVVNEMKEDNEAYDKGRDNGRESRSSCFLTTACTESAGLPDSCHELNVLRQFRDNYVTQQPNGRNVIAEYYANAPRIVAQIGRSHQRAAILQTVLSDVRHAVFLIENGEHKSAFDVYTTMFRRLQAHFSK